MNQGNNFCPYCGARTDANSQHCANCGQSIGNTNVGANTSNQNPNGNVPPKKSKKIIGIISSIVLIAIASAIGKFVGKSMVEGFYRDQSTDEIAAYIDEYIENNKDYVAGYCTDEKYVSEHLNLEFTINDDWMMYTEEELVPLTETVRASAIASATETMEEENISKELIDKWISSVYAETEMGACYIADDMIVGEVTVGVFSGFGIDELDKTDAINDFIQGLEQQLSAMADNVSTGEEIIAGSLYNSVTATIVADGITMTNTVFVRIEDSMICMIACKAIDGYEEETLESFLSQCSELK